MRRAIPLITLIVGLAIIILALMFSASLSSTVKQVITQQELRNLGMMVSGIQTVIDEWKTWALDYKFAIEGILSSPIQLDNDVKNLFCRNPDGTQFMACYLERELGVSLPPNSRIPELNRYNIIISPSTSLDAVKGEIAKILLTEDFAQNMRRAHPEIVWIYYTSRDGWIALMPVTTQTDFMLNWGKRKYIPWFTPATPTANPDAAVVLSPPYRDEAGTGWLITILAPVYVNGDFKGAASIDISIKTLAELVESLHAGHDYGYAIIYRNQIITSHNIEKTISIKELLPSVEESLLKARPVETTDAIVIAMPLTGEWKVAGVVSKAYISKVVARLNLILVTMIIVILALVMLSAFVLMTSVFKPIVDLGEQLADTEKAYSRGVEITGLGSLVPEVRLIAEKVNQFIRQIKQQEEEMATLARYINGIVEYIPSAIITVEPIAGEIIHTNRLGLKLLGASDRMEVVRKPIGTTPLAPLEKLIKKVKESSEVVYERYEDLIPGRIFRAVAFPIKIDKDITLIGIQLTDITEMEKMEQNLAQAQKMEVLGLMAGGFAHDFNNILAAMWANLQLLEQLTPRDNPDIAEILTDMKTVIKRAKEMVEKILIFSKNRKPHPVAIDLVEAVKETVKMAKGSIPPDIEIEMQEKCRPTVKMDQSHLTQIVLNIVLNARDALIEKGGSGKIAITVECEGNHAILRIGNNGPPIPADIIEKIFEPFFTTKTKGGTGLGLAIVKKLVETAGGTIEVKSDESWTEFIIRFPIHTTEENQEVILTEENKEISPGNGEKILLVEDDETVGKALKNLLEQNGYVVKWLKDPTETADLLERWEPQLVISDYAMPRLTGRDIVRIVRMLSPGTPVLIITAYEGVDTAGAPVLMKPLQPSVLLKTIRRMIDKNDSADNS